MGELKRGGKMKWQNVTRFNTEWHIVQAGRLADNQSGGRGGRDVNGTGIFTLHWPAVEMGTGEAGGERFWRRKHYKCYIHGSLASGRRRRGGRTLRWGDLIGAPQADAGRGQLRGGGQLLLRKSATPFSVSVHK